MTFYVTGRLDRKAVSQFEDVMNEVGIFPTLDSNWNISDFDMDSVLIELAKLSEFLYFFIQTFSSHVIGGRFSQPGLTEIYYFYRFIYTFQIGVRHE